MDYHTFNFSQRSATLKSNYVLINTSPLSVVLDSFGDTGPEEQV